MATANARQLITRRAVLKKAALGPTASALHGWSDSLAPAVERFIRIGVLADHTGSAITNSTPAVLPKHLAAFTALIKARGGSMAVYSVAERAEGGTVRLTIDPPSAMPQSPTLAGSIFEQRRAAARYRAELQRWLAGESARQEKASGVIRTFEAQLAPALLSQRNEKRSDVWNAVLRLDRYWAEAMPLSGYAADPYGLIVSDLQHTAGGQRYTLSSNPRVAWVYRAAKRPPIFDAPQIFESVEPAVAWIVSQAAASHNGAAIGKK